VLAAASERLCGRAPLRAVLRAMRPGRSAAFDTALAGFPFGASLMPV
jgi:hypothetical protein